MPYQGGWFWPLGVLFWLLVVFLLVRFLFWRRPWWGACGWAPWRGYGPYGQGPRQGTGPWTSEGEPTAVLRLRLAKGEITQEEYERLKAVLER